MYFSLSFTIKLFHFYICSHFQEISSVSLSSLYTFPKSLTVFIPLFSLEIWNAQLKYLLSFPRKIKRLSVMFSLIPRTSRLALQPMIMAMALASFCYIMFGKYEFKYAFLGRAIVQVIQSTNRPLMSHSVIFKRLQVSTFSSDITCLLFS